MRQNASACRIAYNFAVGLLKDERQKPKEERAFISPQVARKRFTEARDERFPWMRDERLVMAGINDAINVNFAAALARWKKEGWSAKWAPKFKRKGHRVSVKWPYIALSSKHVDGRTVTLPQKMGTARIAERLPAHGDIKSVTFSEVAGKWYAAFLIALDAPPQPCEPAPEGTAIGVDVGVKNFVATSDGALFPPAADFNRERAKIAKHERQLARKQKPDRRTGQKPSKNYLKKKRQIAKKKARLANIRKDYAEKVSIQLATNYQIVAIEDLKLKNMTASAKGDAENHGKNVRQKAGLNRSMLDGAFHRFRVRLEDKTAARGGRVLAVNPAYTSQTCPACGHVASENRPSQAEFKCQACGLEQHADIVGAQNVLLRAYDRLSGEA